MVSVAATIEGILRSSASTMSISTSSTTTANGTSYYTTTHAHTTVT